MIPIIRLTRLDNTLNALTSESAAARLTPVEDRDVLCMDVSGITGLLAFRATTPYLPFPESTAAQMAFPRMVQIESKEDV
jgi:hypothetical protein